MSSTSHVIYLVNKYGQPGKTAIAVMAGANDQQAQAFADRSLPEWKRAYPSTHTYCILPDPDYSPYAPPEA